MVKAGKPCLTFPGCGMLFYDGLFLVHRHNFCLYCRSPHPGGFGGMHAAM